MIPFEFPEIISKDDIEAFTACPEGTPVILWTLQHEAAVEHLNRSGQLTGDPTYAFASAVPGKKLAYEWLRGMMAAKLSDYDQEWPVWALLNRPLHSKLADRPNDVLLRIEVPKSRMLIFFYEGWMKLLGVMHHLEDRCGGIWPEQWILYQETPYIDPIQRCPPTTDLDLPVPRAWQFDEGECRKSWEQIFDLTLYGREGFAWADESRCALLQAVIPVVYLSDLGGASSIQGNRI